MNSDAKFACNEVSLISGMVKDRLKLLARDVFHINDDGTDRLKLLARDVFHIHDEITEVAMIWNRVTQHFDIIYDLRRKVLHRYQNMIIANMWHPRIME